jgi:hypothetical protein
LKGHDFSRADSATKGDGSLAPEGSPSVQATQGDSSAPEFLATCALGFREPIVPTGVWSLPRPEDICAVSGGYAYIIDTAAPDRFTMILYRPVLKVIPVPNENLLLFVGHLAILAWGLSDEVWQTQKLSDEGVSITSIQNSQLHGLGWNMITDQETPFAIDLRTGSPIQ